MCFQKVPTVTALLPYHLWGEAPASASSSDAAGSYTSPGIGGCVGPDGGRGAGAREYSGGDWQEGRVVKETGGNVSI